MGLARQAGRLPVIAISWGLEAWERSAGLRQFARRRGDEALQIAAHTPLGRLLPKLVLDDGADEEAARITAAVRETTPPATTKPAAPAPTTPEPTPAPAARETTTATATTTPSAVLPEVEKTVERVVDQLEIDEPQARDELPIPDFDNVTLGSLRARLRNLSVEQLVTLREWEQAHAHRLPVLTILDNRIAKVAADAYPDGNPKPTTSTRSG